MAAAPKPIGDSDSCSSVETVIVPSRHVLLGVWLAAKPHLEAALARQPGHGHIDAVLMSILRDHSQLWLVEDDEEVLGAIVTRILIAETGKRSLLIYLAGGLGLSHDQMLQALARLEDFALKSDCESVVIYGRRGWGKVLPGYSSPFTAFEKELAHEQRPGRSDHHH